MSTEITTKSERTDTEESYSARHQSTKRGERGDKISQQRLQQKANEPIRKSPIRQDISPPNVVREEIRYLNRSYNKKTKNQDTKRRAIPYPTVKDLGPSTKTEAITKEQKRNERETIHG